MKRHIYILFICITVFCTGTSFAGEAEQSAKAKLLEKEYDFDVIVIDPGHVGSDVGAISEDGLYEKDVTIKIAKKLRRLIEQALKVKVYLTRENNEFISLRNRTSYANLKDADVFLSIHANASTYFSISGCETFFYEKDASDEQAALLAEIENKEGVSEDEEPYDPLEIILMDMAKSEQISLSYNLAEVIQQEYVSSVKSRDRGVKQAPFSVLARAKMPAVLTEVGFISSKGKANKFSDKKYIDGVVQALFKSIKKYKEIMDIKNGKVTSSK